MVSHHPDGSGRACESSSAGEVTVAQPSSQAIFTVPCLLHHDWASIIEDVEKTIASDKAEGLKKAHEALNSNPPLFFAEQLNEIVAQNTDQSK